MIGMPHHNNTASVHRVQSVTTDIMTYIKQAASLCGNMTIMLPNNAHLSCSCCSTAPALLSQEAANNEAHRVGSEHEPADSTAHNLQTSPALHCVRAVYIMRNERRKRHENELVIHTVSVAVHRYHKQHQNRSEKHDLCETPRAPHLTARVILEGPGRLAGFLHVMPIPIHYSTNSS
jgi:hypothetical protein